jgi:hypothetical protein
MIMKGTAQPVSRSAFHETDWWLAISGKMLKNVL